MKIFCGLRTRMIMMVYNYRKYFQQTDAPARLSPVIVAKWPAHKISVDARVVVFGVG